MKHIPLLPSFLCLDVPLVALGWALCLAKDRATQGLPWWNLAALFLAVWGIYLGDRILDASRMRESMTLSLRHDWARRHRPLLIVLALIVSSVFALVILPQLGRATVRAGIVAATVTALYFFAFRFSGHRLAFIRCLPAKEFAIGATFAGGIALAASGGSFEAVPLATLAGMTLLFTGNCLVIARAEEAWDQEADPASFYTKGLPPTRLPEVLLGLTFLVGLVKCSSDPGLGPVALLLSAAATLALALFPNRQYFQALADGVLLLPWIVLWVNR